MKPKYRFKYVYPNERVEKRAYKDMIEKNISEYDFYVKYGKYRQLENWDDIEEGYIWGLNKYYKMRPNRARITHLVIYDNIFIGTIALDEIGCKEEDLLDYAKSNLEKFWYIEDLEFEKLKIVRFNFSITYNAEYEEV